MITLILQIVSLFISTNTTEDLTIPFLPYFSKMEELVLRTHSVFQEIQIKRSFCSTCVDLACIYLYVS